MNPKIAQLAQTSKRNLLKRVRAIYFKLKEGLSLDEAEKQVDDNAPPPRGFPHAWRAQRRARNRKARESRRINRWRAA